jgi:hypothetical protein
MIVKSVLIHVRDYSQTYIARWLGKTASCTASREHAARAVVRKVLGVGDPKVRFLYWSHNDQAIFELVSFPVAPPAEGAEAVAS